MNYLVPCACNDADLERLIRTAPKLLAALQFVVPVLHHVPSLAINASEIADIESIIREALGTDVAPQLSTPMARRY